jgi:hypothetical protein
MLPQLSSVDDKQLILPRATAVRTPKALEMALSFTDDKTLSSEAIQTAAALAEALRTSHPPAARPALQRLLKLTDDAELRARLRALLDRMNRQATPPRQPAWSSAEWPKGVARRRDLPYKSPLRRCDPHPAI